MNLKFIRKIINKRNLRSIKAYNSLLKNNEIDKVDAIKEKILDEQLFNFNSKLNNFFYLNSVNDLDISLRQYLYTHLIHIKINEALIKSLAFQDKIIFPLPLQWIKVLEKEKVNVSKFFCLVFWYFFVIKFFLYAQLFSLKEIFKFFFSKTKENKKSFYFSNFPYNEVNNQNKASNFFIMFRNKFGNDCKNFYHDNVNLPNELNLPQGINLIKKKNFTRISSLKLLVSYIFMWPFFSLVSFLLIFFNWSYAVFLKEILLKFIFSHDEKNRFSHYFFSNSISLYRPLWTYDINLNKSKYYFYFYSIASLPIEKKNLIDVNKFYRFFRSNYYGLKYLSWKNFLFWNNFQKDFYSKKLLNNENINYDLIEPTLDFGKNIEVISQKKILSVFDISPFRTSYYAKRNAPLMTHEKMIFKFYEDIINLKVKYNLHLLIKIKRFKFSNVISKRYINYLDKLGSMKDVTLLDESFSVESIINRSDLVICSPFTTPGVTSKLLKKNSVYYDLSPCQYRFPLAYEDVLIIKDYLVLSSWIKENI
jgi:polysaccharide biosynthesis PFTS motif protein